METSERYEKAERQVCRKFPHQISITSKTGAGGTTLLNGLKAHYEKYPYRWVSGGSIMRAFGETRGMQIEEFTTYLRQNPDEGVDIKLDAMTAHFAEQDWVGCESRLSHVFMPGALKVLLVCPLPARAIRCHGRHPNLTVDEVRDKISQRDEDDEVRYSRLYPGCLWPESDFDLVIDTGGEPVEETLRRVIERYEVWTCEALV